MNKRRAQRPRVLEEIGEWGWLERLGRSLPRRAGQVVVGFGDDAACLALPSAPGKLLLLTTDVLVEGTHFTWQTATPATLGEKAVAVNVSDIAAMGGRPKAMVVGVGAPAHFEIARLRAVFHAMKKTCQRWGIALVGGDTVRSERFILAPTLLGEFEGPAKRLPLRNRLREGQNIYVTGTLGDSAAGLALLLGAKRTRGRLPASACRRLVERHCRPRPLVDEGYVLTRHFDDLAMMDLSDDLWTTVGLMSRAGNVGMTIHLDRLPRSRALLEYCRATKRDPFELLVYGGEDYGLLFTTFADPISVEKVLRRAGLQTPVAAIGVVGGRGVRWMDDHGKSVVMKWKPFEHFAEGRR